MNSFTFFIRFFLSSLWKNSAKVWSKNLDKETQFKELILEFVTVYLHHILSFYSWPLWLLSWFSLFDPCSFFPIAKLLQQLTRGSSKGNIIVNTTQQQQQKDKWECSHKIKKGSFSFHVCDIRFDRYRNLQRNRKLQIWVRVQGFLAIFLLALVMELDSRGINIRVRVKLLIFS